MATYDFDPGELPSKQEKIGSVPTLQGRLMEGSTGTILNAMLNAEAHIERREIKFPRIAVLGDESTGKSSVLEAICRIPFPRGAQTTTRCPIQVNLRRVPGSSWSASVWIGSNRDKEERVTNPGEVTATIRRFQEENIRETDRMSDLEGGARFSSEPVNVQVEADDVVDLTLLDLPGYFSHQGRDAKQPQGDVIRIKNTLMSCMSDEHTILLVVVRANQVFGTANIFDLLKEYERPLPPKEVRSFQSRTIYCMTMCDLISGPNRAQDPPQNIEEVLNNNGTFRADPHGWYAVANNVSRDMGIGGFSAKLTHNRQKEGEFFDTVAPYNFPHLRARCGIPNLIQRLSSILSQEIGKVIPEMLKDTRKAIFDVRSDLARLGPPLGKTDDVRREFNNIIDDIRKYYRDLADGDYSGLGRIVLDADSSALYQCKLGYLRSKYCREFAAQVEGERLKVGEKEYMNYLCKQVNEARDGRFELAVPVKQVVIQEVRRCAQVWKALAESLCERIAATALKCLHILIDLKAGRYEKLPNVVKTYATNLINEQKERAMNRLEWHYIDEISRPDSMNKEYEKLVQETRMAPIGKDVRETAEAFNKNLEIYFRFAEGRFADNVIRTITTHILDVPLNDELIRAKTEKPWRFVLQAMEIEKGYDLAELMKVRDDLRVKHEMVQKRLEQLVKLQEALQEQAPAQTEDDDEDWGISGSRYASPNDRGNRFKDLAEEGRGGATFASPPFLGTPPPPPRPQGLSARSTPSWAQRTTLSNKRNDGAGALANGIPGQHVGNVAEVHHMAPMSAPSAKMESEWVAVQPRAADRVQMRQNDVQNMSGFTDGEWIAGRLG